MDIVEEAICTLAGGLFIVFSIIGFVAFVKRVEEMIEKGKEGKKPEIITLEEYAKVRKE